jgi:hypothetical protein
MGRKWTGKKLMENMMTTAINILATLRRVRSWLSNVRFVGFNLKYSPDVLYSAKERRQ